MNIPEHLKEQILEAAERDDNTGFCVSCGAEHSDCEPDTRKRTCDECGEDKVYGAEELLMHILP